MGCKNINTPSVRFHLYVALFSMICFFNIIPKSFLLTIVNIGTLYKTFVCQLPDMKLFSRIEFFHFSPD